MKRDDKRPRKKRAGSKGPGSGGGDGGETFSPPLPPPPPPPEELVTIRTLVENLAAVPSARNARALADAAALLEERFADLRRSAHEIEKGAAAREHLGEVYTTNQPFLRTEVVAPRVPRIEADVVAPVSSDAAADFSSDDGTLQQFEIGQFFESVSSAVVQAQRLLDIESLRYANERAGTPIPPALFAIPKVQAEVKLGFQKVGTSGINVILFNNQTKEEQFGESTVRFDVVSAPAPPGPPGKFTLPIPEFVVTGQEAELVLKATETLPRPQSLAEKPPLAADWKDRAAVYRLFHEPNPRYLVFAYEADAATTARAFAAYLRSTRDVIDDMFFVGSKDFTPSRLNLLFKNVTLLLQAWLAGVKLP